MIEWWLDVMRREMYESERVGLDMYVFERERVNKNWVIQYFIE